MNINLARQFPSFISILIALIFVSCSTKPAVQEFPKTANPHDEFRKLNNEMEQAKRDQVDIKSPKNYELAEEATEEAREGLQDDSPSENVLYQIALAKSYLDIAQNFAEITSNNIDEVMKARDQAVLANASRLVKEDFEEAEEKLRDITTDIENNDLQSAIEERSDLQAEYLEIELEAIKRDHLDKPLANIEKAEERGAEEFAPISLAVAKKNVADLDAYITANRSNWSEINRMANKAEQSTQHLLKITADSKSGKDVSSEEMALRMERAQDQVSDRRAQRSRSQVAMEKMRERNKELESGEALEKQFEKARNLFAEDEAEVYKQSNKMTIRLKGLGFDSSNSQLKSSNYALLSKVQEVLRDFDNSNVIIEGHTDSTGGKEINEKLSRERAEAVKEYLTSNNVGSSKVNIQAVGRAYEKPLASNKTEEGRAMNRRVDIVITDKTKL